MDGWTAEYWAAERATYEDELDYWRRQYETARAERDADDEETD